MKTFEEVVAALDKEFDEKFSVENVTTKSMYEGFANFLYPDELEVIEDYLHTRDTAIRAEVYEELRGEIENRMPFMHKSEFDKGYTECCNELLALIKQPS